MVDWVLKQLLFLGLILLIAIPNAHASGNGPSSPCITNLWNGPRFVYMFYLYGPARLEINNVTHPVGVWNSPERIQGGYSSIQPDRVQLTAPATPQLWNLTVTLTVEHFSVTQYLQINVPNARIWST